MAKYSVWECKIVVPAEYNLPEGFDLPPRRAAIDAVAKFGIPVVACFSGWGGELSETEQACVNDIVSQRADQQAQAAGEGE